MINKLILKKPKGFKNLEEFQSVLLDYLTGHILILDSYKVEINNPDKQIKARLIRNENDDSDILFVDTKYLKKFIKSHYSIGETRVKEMLTISKSTIENFKGDRRRCYKFEFKK